jgi:aspartate aminotransferase
MSELTLKINNRVQQLLASTTLEITARAKALQAEGRDVVNFAGGEPDFDTPDSIKKAAIKAMEDGHTKYTPSTGIPALREAIARKFKRDNNLNYKPSQVAVSCGAKHSIFNAVQVLVDDGEEVIIPAPYWVSYPEMVKISGGVNKIVGTTAATNFKLTPELLKNAITPKTKMLILSSPSNPTGMLYSREELEPIAELCVKHNIYVVSDEIYEKLIYVEEPFTSMASLNDDIYNLTITVNGVSKAYAMTGWRIGYGAGPQEIMEHIKNLQDHSTSNPTSISQYAALQALNEPETLVQGMRRIFKERLQLITSLMDQLPQVSYIKPQGAFYLFCDFSKLGESAEVARRILNEANVAVIPGEGFGARGYMRLSFATSNERIEEGVKRIRGWIEKNYNL